MTGKGSAPPGQDTAEQGSAGGRGCPLEAQAERRFLACPGRDSPAAAGSIGATVGFEDVKVIVLLVGAEHM